MSDSSIAELITAIKESDAQTRVELQEFRQSLQDMNKNFSRYWEHLIVYEEDKKHDDIFKAEVREHIKDAAPLLSYVKTQKTTAEKVKTAFYVAMMIAFLTAIGLTLK